MIQIAIVERGEYADHEILAAFEDPRDAAKFAEDFNNQHQPSWDMRAVVGQLDCYPAGTYHGRTRVIDGEIG